MSCRPPRRCARRSRPPRSERRRSAGCGPLPHGAVPAENQRLSPGAVSAADRPGAAGGDADALGADPARSRGTLPGPRDAVPVQDQLTCRRQPGRPPIVAPSRGALSRLPLTTAAGIALPGHAVPAQDQGLKARVEPTAQASRADTTVTSLSPPAPIRAGQLPPRGRSSARSGSYPLPSPANRVVFAHRPDIAGRGPGHAEQRAGLFESAEWEPASRWRHSSGRRAASSWRCRNRSRRRPRRCARTWWSRWPGRLDGWDG